MQISVSQIGAYILSQVISLEPPKCELFLNWLRVHSNQAIYDDKLEFKCIQDTLVDWFESLSEVGVLQEFHLVTREIHWWRILDDETLAKMLDDFEKDMSNQAYPYFEK